MNTATKILIDELLENSHIEDVSDVIFWALREYAEKAYGISYNATNGSIVANAIVDRIESEELKEEPNIINFEKINYLNK